ncbi:MAG: hypothetical protein ABIB46_00530 [bacterium]
MDEQYEFLTWEQFDKDCKKIYQWAEKEGFQSIYGPPRGGLVLGVKLSHMLKIPLMISKDDVTPHTLIVDDISDTGKTLKNFEQIGCKIATLYYHKQSKVIPDFWIHEKTNKYIKYPWEI